ncbi:MAG: sugar phosphate isomerase/epimerase, partial [Planctomycetes bacterium]|nr:sugar phosphate isomerase/epimerase [Planctomycetota bacterium]
MNELSRRQWLAGATSALGAGWTASAASLSRAADFSAEEPFGYCLNTSTLRGQKLSIVEEVEIAAQAGYQGLEPWVEELDRYVKEGGNLKDLNKRIHDHGLRIPSSIDFFEWIVDDQDRRRKGLEAARHSMDLVRQIGGQHIAAPPAGATDQAGLDFRVITQRYRALLDLGEQLGVIPEVELWGFSKTLSRLGEVMLVAIDSRHPKACILPDVFHLYK